MTKRINVALMAAIAVLDDMDEKFDPLTEEQKIDAMEHIIDDLNSRIRCAEDPGVPKAPGESA